MNYIHEELKTDITDSDIRDYLHVYEPPFITPPPGHTCSPRMTLFFDLMTHITANTMKMANSSTATDGTTAAIRMVSTLPAKNNKVVGERWTDEKA